MRLDEVDQQQIEPGIAIGRLLRCGKPGRSERRCLPSFSDQLFDRCPADLLAYLTTHRDTDGFDLELWLPRARSAMRRLDLIVYVPIEAPDRIEATEGDKLRGCVDEELREILLDDRWDFHVEVLEVAGSTRERLDQILAKLGKGAG